MVSVPEASGPPSRWIGEALLLLRLKWWCVRSSIETTATTSRPGRLAEKTTLGLCRRLHSRVQMQVGRKKLGPPHACKGHSSIASAEIFFDLMKSLLIPFNPHLPSIINLQDTMTPKPHDSATVSTAQCVHLSTGVPLIRPHRHLRAQPNPSQRQCQTP